MANGIAIAYIRVSTDEQAAEGVSLAAQQERVQAYCVAAGLQLAEVIREEGVSGKVELSRRPQGARLAKAMKKHGATHIITLKLDRLFRNTRDALGSVDKWDKAGIGLHIVDMGGQAISTNSAVGRMFLTMLAGFAQFERDLTSERTRVAMAHKRMKQEFVGTVPYGFTCEGGQLVPDATEQALVARIFMLREKMGLTLQAIADILTEDGAPTKRGGRWYPSTVKSILTNKALYTAAA